MSRPPVASFDADVDADDEEVEFAGAGAALEFASDRSKGIYTKTSYTRMLTRVSGPRAGSAVVRSVSVVDSVAVASFADAAA